jgi:hypothetical protein
LALVRDFGIRNDKLYFWVTLKTVPDSVVKELPLLILERLDAKGNASETRKLPLPATVPAGAEGWTGGPRHVELNHVDLKPGTWRLRIEGIAGPDKRSWVSEPRTFRVEMSGSTARPSRSVWSGLLRAVTGAPDPIDASMPPDPKVTRKVILDDEPT